MKNIIAILFIGLISSPFVNAQIIEEPLFQNTNYGKINGAYYKDMDNDYNPYVGTWIYTNGNTTLKVEFQKKEMVYDAYGTKYYYVDELVGEYQYIESGVEKVNTLSNLSINYTDMLKYNLYGSSIVLNNVYPKCDECPDTERRISMSFAEPTRRNTVGLWGGAMLRHYTENGVEKIKMIVYKKSAAFVNPEGNGVRSDNGEPLESNDLKRFSVPLGAYILVKQP